ncbi:hypothetical protein GTA08_BOTSDO08601 [Botryosphaeria dothidea]|uniref:Uncharacterized protein n=1 Tax=Botryosphaeria dothidea TaxID=55169 RepID=A0A8H4IK92_9PEZI|nr:hypothetical protein GTA08_BOTSDO08601 [Botryosphaeria dothidea]
MPTEDQPTTSLDDVQERMQQPDGGIANGANKSNTLTPDEQPDSDLQKEVPHPSPSLTATSIAIDVNDTMARMLEKLDDVKKAAAAAKDLIEAKDQIQAECAQVITQTERFRMERDQILEEAERINQQTNGITSIMHTTASLRHLLEPSSLHAREETDEFLRHDVVLLREQRSRLGREQERLQRRLADMEDLLVEFEERQQAVHERGYMFVRELEVVRKTMEEDVADLDSMTNGLSWSLH